MNETFNVAVYGTLLEGERNDHWAKGALSRRKASLRGVLYDTGCGFPAFLPKPTGGNVEAEVLEVDAKGLARMDVLEGYPNLYRREWVMATLEDGAEVKAFVYVMNRLPKEAKVIACGSWRRRNDKPKMRPRLSGPVEIDVKALTAAHTALCALLDSIYGIISETGDISRYCANPAKVLGDADKARKAIEDVLVAAAIGQRKARSARKAGR